LRRGRRYAPVAPDGICAVGAGHVRREPGELLPRRGCGDEPESAHGPRLPARPERRRRAGTHDGGGPTVTPPICLFIYAGREPNLRVQRPFLDRLLRDWPTLRVEYWNLTRNDEDD